MSKVVVFKASPRKNGKSTELMECVVEGAKSNGAEVVVYDLNDKGARGCQSCFYCATHDGCVQKDYLQPMYKDIDEADSIVATFPIYFMNINAQAKIWIDRLHPMFDSNFQPRHPNKKVVAIYAQSTPDESAFNNIVENNNAAFKMFGWNLVKSFLLSNTMSPDMKISDETKKEAFEIGKSLV